MAIPVVIEEPSSCMNCYRNLVPGQHAYSESGCLYCCVGCLQESEAEAVAGYAVDSDEEERENPSATEISLRQFQPKRWYRYARKTLAEARPGRGTVYAIVAWAGSKGGNIQSLRFPRSEWTSAEAKRWAKSHGFKADDSSR